MITKDFAIETIRKLERELAALGYQFFVGAELEFYCAKKLDLLQYRLEKERGNGQFELKYDFNMEPINLCDTIDLQRKFFLDNFEADFSAKAFPDDYGSALQFSINLIDHKSGNFSDELMLKIIAGLLDSMISLFYFFAPLEEDYKRFVSGFHAPVNVSWGGNNRSTALRIPEIGAKRIEHRVASASACPYMVLMSIMLGVLHGIKRKLPLPAKIWGVASDDIYQLKSFPKTRNEAQKLLDFTSYL